MSKGTKPRCQLILEELRTCYEYKYNADFILNLIDLLEAGWEINCSIDFDIVHQHMFSLWDLFREKYDPKLLHEIKDNYARQILAREFFFKEISNHTYGDKITRNILPSHIAELEDHLTLLWTLPANSKFHHVKLQTLLNHFLTNEDIRNYLEISHQIESYQAKNEQIPEDTIWKAFDLFKEDFFDLVLILRGSQKGLDAFRELFSEEEPIIHFCRKFYENQLPDDFFQISVDEIMETCWFKAFEIVRPQKSDQNVADATALFHIFKLNNHFRNEKKKIFFPILSDSKFMAQVLNWSWEEDIGDSLPPREACWRTGLTTNQYMKLNKFIGHQSDWNATVRDDDGAQHLRGKYKRGIEVDLDGKRKPFRLHFSTKTLLYFLTSLLSDFNSTRKRILQDRKFIMGILNSVNLTSTFIGSCMHYKAGKGRFNKLEEEAWCQQCAQKNQCIELFNKMQELKKGVDNLEKYRIIEKQDYINSVFYAKWQSDIKNLQVAVKDISALIIETLESNERYGREAKNRLDNILKDTWKSIRAKQRILPETIIKSFPKLDKELAIKLYRYPFGLSRIVGMPYQIRFRDPDIIDVLDQGDGVLKALHRIRVSDSEGVLDLEVIKQLLQKISNFIDPLRAYGEKKLFSALWFQVLGENKCADFILNEISERQEDIDEFDLEFHKIFLSHEMAIIKNNKDEYLEVVERARAFLRKYGDQERPRAFRLPALLIGRGILKKWYDGAKLTEVIKLLEDGLELLKKRYPERKINGLITLQFSEASPEKQKDIYTWILFHNNLAYSYYMKIADDCAKGRGWNAEEIRTAVKHSNIVKLHKEIQHRWTPQIYDTFGCVRRLEALVENNINTKIRILDEAKREILSALEFQKVLRYNPRDQGNVLRHIKDIDRDMRRLTREGRGTSLNNQITQFSN